MTTSDDDDDEIDPRELLRSIATVASPSSVDEATLRITARLFARAAGPLWGAGVGSGVEPLRILRDELRLAGLAYRRVSSEKREISRALRVAVFERDAYRCVDCGTWHDLTADHIVPESAGGSTTLDNLATRCRSCNCSKGARPL